MSCEILEGLIKDAFGIMGDGWLYFLAKCKDEEKRIKFDSARLSLHVFLKKYLTHFAFVFLF